jgi:hypothetical protein
MGEINSQEEESEPSEEEEDKEDPEALGLCREHKNDLELICISCKKRICSHCALFGSHKGHDYRQDQEVINEISLKAEILITMYSGIEEQKHELKGSELYEERY